MVNNHKHTPWRKSILVPFWCIQIFFMLLFIALLGLAEGIFVSYENDNNEDWDDSQVGDINDPEHVVLVDQKVIVPVWITICAICLLLTITEIILLARHKLKPLAFLIMNVIKAAFWTALFILDIISVASQGGRITSVIGILVDGVLLLSFWIPLIYGSIVYHRFRKEKTFYKPVDHPFALPIDTHDDTHEQFPQAYATPATAPLRDIESDGHIERARGQSFNHERDTRYETYRRASISPQQPETARFETFESRGLIAGGGEGIPSVYVDHHDGEVFEMESRRSLR